MNWWMAEAMELSQARAPLMTDEHALDLADDLYKACAEFQTPAIAVARFFAAMPKGWNAPPVEAPAACQLPRTPRALGVMGHSPSNASRSAS